MVATGTSEEVRLVAGDRLARPLCTLRHYLSPFFPQILSTSVHVHGTSLNTEAFLPTA